MSQAFAVWLTGLPASGKSTIAHELQFCLHDAGLAAEVLESDAVRRVLTPTPRYSREERELFYRALAFCGSRLAAHGVPVIFDATANRRAYRDLARTMIPQYLEVAVVCPLEVCRERDRKGIYQGGVEGRSATVPGLQEPYEAPAQPDVTIDTVKIPAAQGARLIMQALQARGYLERARALR